MASAESKRLSRSRRRRPRGRPANRRIRPKRLFQWLICRWGSTSYSFPRDEDGLVIPPGYPGTGVKLCPTLRRAHLWWISLRQGRQYRPHKGGASSFSSSRRTSMVPHRRLDRLMQMQPLWKRVVRRGQLYLKKFCSRTSVPVLSWNGAWPSIAA